jgi:diguanylate cyclase (GGDEF)-like protein
MAAFFANQLDFIFFFYGLAFILLGSVCFAIGRGARRGATPWMILGLFGFLHGMSEWLDLLALIVGSSREFTVFRLAFMTTSYVVLLDFARLEAIRLGWKLPGRWIYAPLIVVIAIGAWFGDLNGANALARYVVGFPAAMATSAVLASHAKGAARAEKRWIISVALGFALYAIAAGIVVPAASWWPANTINYGSFAHLTGMPIQFVRGLLACWMAFAIWGFWGQWLMINVASPRYTKFMQKQLVATLAAMATILVAGWFLTDYLGGIYKTNVHRESSSKLAMVTFHLESETTRVKGMVKALAGARAIRSFVAGEGGSADAAAALRLHAEGSGATTGYLLDVSGKVILSIGGEANVEPASAAPYVRAAMAGRARAHFAHNLATKKGSYTASYPIRGDQGTVIGVAVLKTSLAAFEKSLSHFDRPYFLVDAQGLIISTNRADLLFKPLWPRPGKVASTSAPLLNQEILASDWMSIGGTRSFVERRSIPDSDWSLVLITEPQGIFASRVLGIIITLQMATLALVYLVGRERWVHENIQMERRLELEELARTLDFRATTDPLTGLFNRRKFNRELAMEMLRAQRYGTPLSLVMYDIDQFKSINDTYGHQAGDAVLIELSHFVGAHIRQNDALARWGGEEFMILSPGCDGAMARQLAEKLCDAIRTLTIDGVVHVTCSFGVAQFEPDDMLDEFVTRADQAMYRAKIAGRNRVELALPNANGRPELARGA